MKCCSKEWLQRCDHHTCIDEYPHCSGEGGRGAYGRHLLFAEPHVHILTANQLEIRDIYSVYTKLSTIGDLWSETLSLILLPAKGDWKQ